MTDLPPSDLPPSDPGSRAPTSSAGLPRAQKAGRGLKILLAVSLALNLAVAGVVAGAALRRGGAEGPPQMAVRDLSFGPFTEALTREQRRALLRDFAQRGPGLRDLRSQMRDDFDDIVSNLRATPFDAAAFQAAVAAQGERFTARTDTARMAMVGLISKMSEDERAAFAARLENALTRKGNKDGERRRP